MREEREEGEREGGEEGEEGRKEEREGGKEKFATFQADVSCAWIKLPDLPDPPNSPELTYQVENIFCDLLQHAGVAWSQELEKNARQFVSLICPDASPLLRPHLKTAASCVQQITALLSSPHPVHHCLQ